MLFNRNFSFIFLNLLGFCSRGDRSEGGESGGERRADADRAADERATEIGCGDGGWRCEAPETNAGPKPSCFSSKRFYLFCLTCSYVSLTVVLVQVRRVQKYVEKLDVLKIKNANSNGQTKTSKPSAPAPEPAVMMTKWETFDSLFSPSASSAATSAASSRNPTPRLAWEMF